MVDEICEMICFIVLLEVFSNSYVFYLFDKIQFFEKLCFLQNNFVICNVINIYDVFNISVNLNLN